MANVLLAEFEIKPPGVFGLDPVVNLDGIIGRLLFQNCGQGGASVFRIDIDAAAENGLLANVCASQVETALDRQVGFIFDLLRHDFTEDELLGEVLGADHDDICARRSASGEKTCKRESKNGASQNV